MQSSLILKPINVNNFFLLLTLMTENKNENKRIEIIMIEALKKEFNPLQVKE